jgi:hypothetical protein
MPKKKLVMEFAGLTVDSTCMKCGYLNPEFKEMYRCCCKGSCPHYLTQEQKDELIATWNPIEIEVPTFEEEMDKQYSNIANDICKMEDERVLREIFGDMNFKTGM